jgi:hypothetical protein
MERKGQMIFEFMVAAVLFFGIVLYIMSYLNASMATFSDDLYINSLHSKALSASELLVVSEGNWSGSTPISIGLASGYPVLDSTKMQYLQSYCSNNYRDTLDKLNIMGAPFYLAGGGKGFDAYLEINETGGASRLSCGQPPGGALFAEVHRVALSDDSPKKVLLVRVMVW